MEELEQYLNDQVGNCDLIQEIVSRVRRIVSDAVDQATDWKIPGDFE
jgi:hypothetical protein